MDDLQGLTWDSKSLANQNNVLNPTINNNKNLNTLSPFQNFSSLPKQQSTSPNLIYSTSPFIAPPNSNSHSRQTSNNNSRQTSTASSTNSGDAFSSLVSFGNKPQNLTLEEQRRGKLSSFTPTPAPTPASYSNFNSPMISKSTSNSGITASTLNFNSTFNSNKPVINEFKPTTPPIPALKPNDVKLTPQTNVNPFPTQPQQKPQDHHWDFDLLSSASNKPPVATTSNPISSSEPQNHAADIFDVGFLSSNNVKKESPIVSSPSPTMKPSATSTPPVKAKVPRKLMEESDESEDDTPYIPSIVKNQGIQWFDDDDEDNKPSVPVSETRGKSFEYSKKNSTENPHDAGNFTYYDNYDHRDRSSSATSASSNAKFPALNDIKSTIDSIQDSQYYQSATQTASIIGASVLSNAKSVFNFSKRKIGEVVEKAKQIDNQQRGGNQEWGIDPNYQRNNQYRENRERQSSSRSWRNEEGWEEYDESKFQDNIPHNREASSKPVQKSVPSPSLPARKPLQQQSAMPKTSPVQKPQFFETASIPPTPPPRPKQVILPPPIPDTILSQYETLKSLGNEAYKLGQYPDSETHYTTAINLNPISIGDALHVIQISLYQNRATARQKIGNYTGVIEDCTFVLSRCNQGEFGEDGWEEVNVKALIRRAGAYEGMEKWKDAEKDYEEVKGMGKGAMVQDGLRRCKLALSSDNSNAQPAKSNVNNDLFFVETTSAVPVRQQTPVRSPKPVSDSVKVAVDEAVQRLRTQNAQAEEEDSKKLAIKDELDAKIAAWKAGKEANLRALLSSLDTILWKELGVQKIALSELITPQQVKIKYMKAVSKVHPDKLPQNTTIEQKLIANTVFSALNHAWDAFKAQNGL
ncbi:hypothetical protein HK098_005489 [Nowakowskiella sp. JEL0407]|nr:hypothetical protein HK098_005489 [Nowakowskiella sp. JEL0407]